MDDRWQALAREAASAAEHLAVGATALGRANYAQTAYYQQAFFALSVGLERTSKLVMAVDHAIDHAGAFPDRRFFQSLSHNLDQLLGEVATRAAARGSQRQMPSDAISRAIVTTLTHFANNITRYYNLEILSGQQRAQADEISEWYQTVTVPILTQHYRPRERVRHETNARLVGELLGGMVSIRFTTEDGQPLSKAESAAAHTAAAEVARRWERVYVMRVARFLASAVSVVTAAAQQARLGSIPYLNEFYAIYNNDDQYFRERKTWSIYP